jgi:DNA modification methylase
MAAKHQLKFQTIYCGDNLKMLNEIPDESIDLIYIDPPFNSNRNYEIFWGDTQEKRAFEDRFGDAEAYIQYMRPRVTELYRVLKETGSFYYHCDWHASHYVKIMLDQIFSFNNFQNEIIWQRSLGHHLGTRRLDNITDSIFFYAKSKKYIFNKTYNQLGEAEMLKKFPLIEKETERRFNHQKLEKTSNAYSIGEERTIEGRTVKTDIGWIWTQQTFDERLKENPYLIYWTETGRPRYKLYLDEYEGRSVTNLWNDILALSSNSKESLGYPTQKPLELLERIITQSSNEGDVVLDAFCGCGTTLVASKKLKRKWIGIDISPTACRVMSQRLWDIFRLEEGSDFTVKDLRKSEDELRGWPHFEFQNWANRTSITLFR